MDPTLPIFGAIANATANAAQVELGEGILLRKCAGYIGSYSIVAFSEPPAPGRAHPAPWLTVENGNTGFDIKLEVFIPVGITMPQNLTRLNLVWFIAHLLRIRQECPLFVPAISNRTFAEPPPERNTGSIVKAERLHRRWWAEAADGPELNDEAISWVRANWRPALQLWNDPIFRNLVEAFDVLAIVATPALGLVLLFGALESVFLAGMNVELTFRLSAYIASYLEPPGHARIALKRFVSTLYGARSKAAHGAQHDSLEALRETERLFRRILLKIIDERRIPTVEMLEDALFSAQDPDAAV